MALDKAQKAIELMIIQRLGEEGVQGQTLSDFRESWLYEDGQEVLPKHGFDVFVEEDLRGTILLAINSLTHRGIFNKRGNSWELTFGHFSQWSKPNGKTEGVPTESLKTMNIRERSYVDDTQSLVAGPTYRSSPLARKNAANVAS